MNQANQFFENQNYKSLSRDDAPIIVAWHLKTPENAGHLLRLAANVGCRQVLFVKAEDEVLFKDTKMKYVAGPAAKQIKWDYCRPDEITLFVPPDYSFVALETSAGSQNIYHVQLPQKMALMVGSEKSGIPEVIRFPGQMDVHIPMLGPVKSMNVSHAASVCLFEWMRVWG